MKYKQKIAGNHRTVESKKIIFVLCPEFENGSSWNPAISFFRVPTKDDEYSINWRNNILAVVTRDTAMKAI